MVTHWFSQSAARTAIWSCVLLFAYSDRSQALTRSVPLACGMSQCCMPSSVRPRSVSHASVHSQGAPPLYGPSLPMLCLPMLCSVHRFSSLTRSMPLASGKVRIVEARSVMRPATTRTWSAHRMQDGMRVWNWAARRETFVADLSRAGRALNTPPFNIRRSAFEH